MLSSQMAVDSRLAQLILEAGNPPVAVPKEGQQPAVAK
jgi:hypothetical protein